MSTFYVLKNDLLVIINNDELPNDLQGFPCLVIENDNKTTFLNISSPWQVMKSYSLYENKLYITDSRGEKRVFSLSQESKEYTIKYVLSIVSSFPNFHMYDESLIEKENEELKKEEKRLREKVNLLISTLFEIDQINSQAGAGSRKRVKKLINLTCTNNLI